MPKELVQILAMVLYVPHANLAFGSKVLIKLANLALNLLDVLASLAILVRILILCVTPVILDSVLILSTIDVAH